MKTKNSKSSLSRKNDLRIASINNGITKKLLEKYKPKDLYNIESMHIRENEKRIA